MNDDSWCSAAWGIEITVVQLRLAPLSFTHWNSSRFLESFNYVMHCWRWNIQISSYLSLRNIVFKHFIIFSCICWQTGDPRPIFAPKGLDLSWMLLLYHHNYNHLLTSTVSKHIIFNQFTLLLALNCSCPNFFWNVLQVWMTGKDVYLQMAWSWPDKTWNFVFILSQWNTSQINLEITTFFFYLRFPYFPNFFWFGVVLSVDTHISPKCERNTFIDTLSIFLSYKECLMYRDSDIKIPHSVHTFLIKHNICRKLMNPIWL